MKNIGFSSTDNLGIHFWKYGFTYDQNNVKYIYDDNLKIGLCGDSFSIGKVDGSVISANGLGNQIISNF